MLTEINIMRKLNHPNIIKLYEVHESPSTIYLVLNLVQGGELLKRMKDKEIFTLNEVKELTKNIISALAYIHEQ